MREVGRRWAGRVRQAAQVSPTAAAESDARERTTAAVVGLGEQEVQIPEWGGRASDQKTQEMEKTGWNERDKNERRGERKEKAEPGGVSGLWTVEGGTVGSSSVTTPQDLRTDLKKKRVQRFARRMETRRFGCSAKRNGRLVCAWHPGPRPNFA